MKAIIEYVSWTSERYTPEIIILFPKITPVVIPENKFEAFNNQIEQRRGRLPVVNGMPMRKLITNL
jgi:hypothetical protein